MDTFGVDDTDEIFLEGLECYGFHGVHAEERVLGQRFTVDVSLRADLRAAGATDDLGETVSYSAVARRVKAIVEGPPFHLIERAAEEVATTLLAEFPLATRVTVTLRKPNAPIKGIVFAAAGVTVRRTREFTA